MHNLPTTVPSRHRRNILAFAGDLWVIGIVLLHIAAAAATGSVDALFDGWGDEVVSCIIGCGANVA